MNQKKTGVSAKDLRTQAPRSPKVLLGEYAIMARTIDKCRATIAGINGEYHFDCPLDNMLFSFKGIKADEFRDVVAKGASDDEIYAWVSSHGLAKTDNEVREWTATVIAENYASKPEKKAWLEGENARLLLPKDGTLFDFLEADDIQSFSRKI